MSNSQEISLKKDYKIFFGILFKPLIIFPATATFGLLYIANANLPIDYSLTVMLNILASITLAFSGGFLVDAYKKLTGNDLLVKKGLSAVRNLALCRYKITKISKRASKASQDEIENFLDMLEKDIANATQEWDDIIPGVTAEIESNYTSLKIKEEELKTFQDELEKIRKQNLNDNKDKEKIAELSKNIADLQKQVKNIEIRTAAPVFVSHEFDRSYNRLVQLSANVDHNTNSTSIKRESCSQCHKFTYPGGLVHDTISGKMICHACKESNAKRKSS